MKKILIICHTFSSGGGSEKVLNTLLHELNNKYHIDIIEHVEDNTMIYQLPPNVRKLRSMSFAENKLYNEHKSVFKGKLWHFALSFFILWCPKIIYRFYIKNIYDYEISFNYLYSSSLVAHSRNKKSYKIMWMHGTINDLDYHQYSGISKLKYYLYFKMQNTAFLNADTIVPISIKTRDSIFRLYPKVISKLELIHNGYNFQEIKNKATLNIEHTSFISKNSFKIVSIGRLDLNKNVLLQIEVVKSILECKPIPIDFYIIGSGEMEKDLKQAAGRYLGQSIFFMGYLSNPYPILKASNLLLVTSHSEGFPTVIVEALSLGIPVITTKVGGSDELIKNGVNGFTVEMDKNTIVSAILNLQAMQLSTETIQDTVKVYTKEKWQENIIKLLESYGRS
jgi:glycosyltransferase involved in cell wall biosynthesis